MIKEGEEELLAVSLCQVVLRRWETGPLPCRTPEGCPRPEACRRLVDEVLAYVRRRKEDDGPA
jgi:hypothetical protein